MVTLTFLGTRGHIEAKSRRHRRHSVLGVSYRGRRLLIDCSEDWHGELPRLRPDAIVLTHAHPDHAGGLRHGAPCPVYAPREVWQSTPYRRRCIRRPLPHRKPRTIHDLVVEAFPVIHSLRAPAFGYRITAGLTRVFYVPDVVAIPAERQALAGIALYIGDGATLTHPILRTRDGTLIGHIPIRTQLEWCGRQGVRRAIFTHCGSQIVEGDERRLRAEVRGMGHGHGVDAELAWDGMEVVLR